MSNEEQELLFSYGPEFLDHYAGRIITDVEIALVELVANCWDAGADVVNIAWPLKSGERFSFSDNGIGMTRAELEHRWMTLNYNREQDQGHDVVFAPSVRHRKRAAFGRNGVGRHAMFCFADEYAIDTKKDGRRTVARVCRTTTERRPYAVNVDGDEAAAGNRTIISALVTRMPVLTATAVGESLRMRFVIDPEFKVHVNDIPVTLTDIESIRESHLLTSRGAVRMTIRRIDAESIGRTQQASWSSVVGPEETSRCWAMGVPERADPGLTTCLSQALHIRSRGRRSNAACENGLDWLPRRPAGAACTARRGRLCPEDLRGLLQDVCRQRKRVALEQNVQAIKSLPSILQDQIAAFVEEVQVRRPTFGERELADSVQVLARLESTGSGYAQVSKLAERRPEALDGPHSLLSESSVSDAKKVFGELRYRLSLIKELEMLVDAHRTDELS